MQNTFSYITKWLASLGGELTRVTPSATITSVIASLIAQVSLLITFLLPLKILMLMSTQHLPEFLPSTILNLGLEFFVLILCVVTLFFYLIQIAATKVAEKSSVRGAQELLDSANKVLLFDNQKELAKNAYQQFSGLLSCLLFCLISLSILLWFYPEIAVVILICTVFFLHLHTYTCKSEHSFSDLNHVQLAFKVNSSVSAAFFIVFIFIVIDFLYLSPPNFLIALGSFIISRQIIANLGTVIRNTYALTKNHDKITALFFHHQALESDNSSTDTPLWNLINEQEYEWIRSQLVECLDLNVREMSVNWLDTGLSNIGSFEVDLNGGQKHFLVKVFDKAALSQADHEESFLNSNQPQNLFSPPLLLTNTVSGVRCHIYDLTDMPILNQNEPWRKGLETLEVLLTITTSDTLKKQYSRSKKILHERFKKTLLKHLELVSLPADKLEIAEFYSRFDQLLAILKSLPQWVINPQINQILAIKSKDYETKIVHLGKWELEPVGACWPVIGKNTFELIEPALNRASGYRPELAIHPIDHYQLSALTYALETELLALRFKQSLKLIHQINQLMANQNEFSNFDSHGLTQNHV